MSTEQTLSKSQQLAAKVAALLRARNPVIVITTREEARVEGFLVEAAASAGYNPRFWDIAQGVTKLDGTKFPLGSEDFGGTLGAIEEQCKIKDSEVPKGGTKNKYGEVTARGVWIMRDALKLLDGPVGWTPVRQLRNLARYLPSVVREKAQAIVIISAAENVPEELKGHVTIIPWALPDRAEMAATLDAALASLPEFETNPETGELDESKPMRALAAPEGVYDLAIDAAIGLTAEEASSCYALSLVQFKKIDPTIISNEKRRVISQGGVLEWHDPIAEGLGAIGGLDNFKKWIVSRKNARTKAAREYGLPAPKGCVVVGVSGCGKSLGAKAIATDWGVPLLRLDLGALKDKYVGGSEGNLRKAINIIEAIGPCVVWIDEIEKALAGATEGAADGGVSADALGKILNWMQERTGEAFVIATANDIGKLPPELCRKGRFDEVWFVDLPNAIERQDVLKAALRKNGRGAVKFNYAAVAEACTNFTGAEIAEIVPAALYEAYEQDAREINTADLIAAAKNVAPLAITAKEKVEALRKWASDNGTRAATAPIVELVSTKGGRQLDIG